MNHLLSTVSRSTHEDAVGPAAADDESFRQLLSEAVHRGVSDLEQHLLLLEQAARLHLEDEAFEIPHPRAIE